MYCFRKVASHYRKYKLGRTSGLSNPGDGSMTRSDMLDPQDDCQHLRDPEVSMTPRTLTLPVEIWEAIIDEVSGPVLWDYRFRRPSTETLRACSLTCRSWQTRSQWNLFRFLRVNRRRDVMTTQDVSRVRPNHTGAVRHLDIIDTNPFADDSLKAYGVSQLVTDLLPLLAALEGIRFCNINLSPLDHGAMHTFTLLTSLRRLYLDEASLASLTQLEALVLSLPSLTQLSLESLDFSESAPETSSYPNLAEHSRLPRLQTVKITYDHIHPPPIVLYDWLSRTPVTVSLTSFTYVGMQSIYSRVDEKAPAVARLLRARGTLLRELTLSACLFNSPELCLQACPALRRLCIRDATKYLLGCVNLALPYIRSSLSQMCFEFTNVMARREPDDDRVWQALDNILQNTPFQNLNEVSLRRSPCDPSTRLPRTSDRGILTFTVDNGWPYDSD
ncbi:unnamed protein product [Somion occarium]|uniref:F-box domain-containing protein n=1 Tax=Somion occarium TaxID=3059160 RepID=A0ABP1DSC3_9APHY